MWFRQYELQQLTVSADIASSRVILSGFRLVRAGFESASRRVILSDVCKLVRASFYRTLGFAFRGGTRVLLPGFRVGTSGDRAFGGHQVLSGLGLQ